MAKFNKSLLPIKAHYFFFMAAMGPILPQTNVFGKELGISPDVMGFITSVLPILYVLAKPLVGYLIDYFPNMRKAIFQSIVTLMIICFGGFYFIPPVEKENVRIDDSFYETLSFWCFVFLMCLGTIGFNVSNCVSDAACFDVLGDKPMNYGAQRVWGTIGFGFTALVSGIIGHVYQIESSTGIKSLTPALLIMIIFGIFDLISIKWLELPKFNSEGESIATKVMDLLRKKEIVIFLCFATLAGILDSFIIYYLFWYIEEMAVKTGYEESIKLIEACVVAAECLGGEILFFLFSGKILKLLGYVHCLSFCFFMYFIRLVLISLIPSPWWLVLIEFFMQGSSYALCYTCIVAYASEISPIGTQNTIQGLVAGMDDGAGFAIGSIIGGQMYRRYGGTISFRVFAIGALVTCLAHIILRASTGTVSENMSHNEKQHEEEKMSELKLLENKNEVKALIIIET